MRKKLLSLTLAALTATLAACGDDDDDAPIAYEDDGQLTVMTRNLYLGADLVPVIAAGQTGNVAAIAGAATATWSLVLANRFEDRAIGIADEIAATRPDVVGLQELSLWRTGLVDGPPPVGTAAEAVTVDYLGLLLRRLREHRLEYVAIADPLLLFDVEAPTGAGVDVRLTDRQTILVRQGVPFTNARGGVFPEQTLLPEQLPGTGPVRRGWTAVDVTIGGQPVTVFNTHLEAFGPDILRQGQAAALAGIIGAGTGPIVLVGDLNSQPGAAGHAVLTAAPPNGAGFSDAWATVHAAEEGLTCCFSTDTGDLRRTTDLLEQRIDYVLWRGALTPTDVEVVGDVLADRIGTAGDTALWPSDHAGVVATFQL